MTSFEPSTDLALNDLNQSIKSASLSDQSLDQYISFRVGDEDYAIDILNVREIKGWIRTTLLPNQPDYVRGVLNLRGAIVPVFDLGCRFGKSLTEATPTHVIIIVSLKSRLIGLLVDTVSDILSVSASQIGPIPDIASSDSDTQTKAQYLKGIISLNDSMVVLLSLEHLFDQFIESSETQLSTHAA